MFAVGHIALGYLFGKMISRLSKQELNIPAVLTFSLLPDVDLVVPWVLHRGPTHSLVFIATVSLLLIFWWKRRALPYIVALASHSLVGDVFTASGVQLLWPYSDEWIRYSYTVLMTSSLEVYVETSLFILMLLAMSLSHDLGRLLKPSRSNLFLLIPFSTVVLPVLFMYPLRIPRGLLLPHLLLMLLVGASFSISLLNHPDQPQEKKRTHKG
jgi:hypothetical protein